MEDILAYDKEPKYTEEELAAGISDTNVDIEEAAASMEMKAISSPHIPLEIAILETR